MAWFGPVKLAVVVSTSLDTRLIMCVSPHDTVASVKREIVSGHELCYPEFGKINLETLETCRQGKCYHLSDTMSIFDSVVLDMKRTCFLTALVTQLQPPTEINTSLKEEKKKKKHKRNASLKEEEKKKKHKRNASYEDTTTPRPTQSRKIGEENFQGEKTTIEETSPIAGHDSFTSPLTQNTAIDPVTSGIVGSSGSVSRRHRTKRKQKGFSMRDLQSIALNREKRSVHYKQAAIRESKRVEQQRAKEKAQERVSQLHAGGSSSKGPLAGEVKEEVQDWMPEDMDCINVYKEFPLVVIDAD